MGSFLIKAQDTSVPTDIASISDLQFTIQNLISYALGLAGIIFFVLLVAGGFKFITAGSDPKAAEGAKKTITSAIAGLVVIILSFLILAIISNVTGVDVTNFNILLQP